MAVSEKKYVEKAIQTVRIDKLALSLHPSQHHVQNLQGHGSNIDEENSTGHYHSDGESASVDAAYTCSESFCLSHYLESSFSGRSRPHRATKPAQLPCSRPNRIQKQGKRVVSLPETHGSKNSFDNLSISARGGPSLRVVSLSGLDLGNNSTLDSPGSVQNNLSSSEYPDSSLDASYHSPGTGSVYRDVRSFPPSDMPTTPSPPSTPESVLVIGNDPRVSKAFLRQCSMSSGKTYDAEDEAGWITWASSPPRPIPALHGPLSLPYARCPSGAEGTIIEDADLPRMIWGLDLEDPNAFREAPSTKSPQPDVAIDGPQASQPSKEAAYDSTCNSKPIHKQLDDKVSDYKESDRQENTTICAKPQSFALVPEYRPQAIHEICPEKSRVWDDAPIDIHKLTPYDACTRKPGIDPLQLKKRSKSTSTSPAFLRAPSRQWSSPPMTPRIFLEPRPGSQITPGPRLSAMEIAQKYRAEQQQSIATGLQPSSPTWSPTLALDFPTGAFSLDSASQSLYQHDSASSFDSRHTSNFSRRNISVEARQMKMTQPELNRVVNLPSADYSGSRSTMNIIDPVSPKESFVRPASANDMSLITKRLPPTRTSSRSQDISPSNISLQRPSALQTRTRLLQGPRIQSIPMTRLIQRRLSSVAEEDAPSSPHTHLQSARLANSNFPDAPNGVGMDVTIKTNIVETEDQGEMQHKQSTLHCEDKENANGTEKPTIRKKWRTRRRAGVPSFNSNQNTSQKKWRS